MFRFIKKNFYLISFLSFSVSFSMEKKTQYNQMQQNINDCNFMNCEKHKKALIQYKENAQQLFGVALDRISQNLTSNKNNLPEYISYNNEQELLNLIRKVLCEGFFRLASSFIMCDGCKVQEVENLSGFVEDIKKFLLKDFNDKKLVSVVDEISNIIDESGLGKDDLEVVTVGAGRGSAQIHNKQTLDESFYAFLSAILSAYEGNSGYYGRYSEQVLVKIFTQSLLGREHDALAVKNMFLCHFQMLSSLKGNIFCQQQGYFDNCLNNWYMPAFINFKKSEGNFSEEVAPYAYDLNPIFIYENVLKQFCFKDNGNFMKECLESIFYEEKINVVRDVNQKEKKIISREKNLRSFYNVQALAEHILELDINKKALRNRLIQYGDILNDLNTFIGSLFDDLSKNILCGNLLEEKKRQYACVVSDFIFYHLMIRFDVSQDSLNLIDLLGRGILPSTQYDEDIRVVVPVAPDNPKINGLIDFCKGLCIPVELIKDSSAFCPVISINENNGQKGHQRVIKFRDGLRNGGEGYEDFYKKINSFALMQNFVAYLMHSGFMYGASKMKEGILEFTNMHGAAVGECRKKLLRDCEDCQSLFFVGERIQFDKSFKGEPSLMYPYMRGLYPFWLLGKVIFPQLFYQLLVEKGGSSDLAIQFDGLKNFVDKVSLYNVHVFNTIVKAAGENGDEAVKDIEVGALSDAMFFDIRGKLLQKIMGIYSNQEHLTEIYKDLCVNPLNNSYLQHIRVFFLNNTNDAKKLYLIEFINKDFSNSLDGMIKDIKLYNNQGSAAQCALSLSCLELEYIKDNLIRNGKLTNIINHFYEKKLKGENIIGAKGAFVTTIFDSLLLSMTLMQGNDAPLKNAIQQISFEGRWNALKTSFESLYAFLLDPIKKYDSGGNVKNECDKFLEESIDNFFKGTTNPLFFKLFGIRMAYSALWQLLDICKDDDEANFQDKKKLQYMINVMSQNVLPRNFYNTIMPLIAIAQKQNKGNIYGDLYAIFANANVTGACKNAFSDEEKVDPNSEKRVFSFFNNNNTFIILKDIIESFYYEVHKSKKKQYIEDGVLCSKINNYFSDPKNIKKLRSIINNIEERYFSCSAEGLFAAKTPLILLGGGFPLSLYAQHNMYNKNAQLKGIMDNIDNKPLQNLVDAMLTVYGNLNGNQQKLGQSIVLKSINDIPHDKNNQQNPEEYKQQDEDNFNSKYKKK